MRESYSWLADFASDFIVYVHRVIGFLLYATGNVLLLSIILSFIRNNEIILSSIIEGTFVMFLLYSLLALAGTAVAIGLVAATVHTVYLQVPAVQRVADPPKHLLLRAGIRMYLLAENMAGKFDVRPLLRDRWYASDLHVLRLRRYVPWQPIMAVDHWKLPATR